MQKKTRTWITVGAGVLVLGGILSLFEDDKDNAEAEAKPSATAPAKPAKQPTTAAPRPSSGVPSPDTAQTAKLIAALRDVDPGLVVKESRAVSRARDVCADLKQHKDPDTVRSNAKQRYQGGTVPSLSDDQAARIVSAVEESFCG
ncbi:DUF732 domain-containing protein [Streptomyces olivoreticuli]|uniref:DUF732 domain-containing protein n=1 Tax=Streptomyces olivoreticuli TaxID=68246 RepID=UPI000E27A1CC|nr:DUF732 domain-containing protein [Streptomyces olivoreticuli]